MDDFHYTEEITKWRAERAKALSAPYGWLAISGLFWLQPGINRIGSSAEYAVHLPHISNAGPAGQIVLDGEDIWLESETTSDMRIDGVRISRSKILIEDETSPEIILGDLKLYVIRRGSRYGVRVYDPQNPARLSFAGLEWFPVQKEYVIKAAFEPFSSIQMVQVLNILGDFTDMRSPGMITFHLDGLTFRLQPVLTEDDRLWIMFRDKTNGFDTYPAGRFLMVDPPENGKTIIDFNKAYNPPCAYTEFATCPIPLPGNRIDYPISAGERKFH